MKELIAEFLDEVNQPSTTVSLFYYSGHGIQIADKKILNRRRLLTSFLASIITVIGGLPLAAVAFGPLYFLGIVNALESWRQANPENPIDLLVGGAVYGVPLGLVLGSVIGTAVIFTEKWSKKPVIG